jgi:predicted PurR-regulated permease PerM
MLAERSQDLARTTLQILALGVLIASSFWILRPFLLASAWATMIVVATWPLLLRAQARLGGRRSLGVALMTTSLSLILVLPLYFGVMAIVNNATQIGQWSTALTTLTVPKPPAWIGTLPLVGARVTARWQQLAAASPEEVSAQLTPFARTLALWLAGQVGSVGLLFVHFLLTLIIVAILYANGETAARGAERFARRLSGRQGANALHLATQAVRAVALGVVVTALLQSALAGIGLVIADVPFAPFLTALIFVLAIAQVGAGPVLLAAVIWVYAKSGTAWGTGFLVWAIFCSILDNFVRPMLIKRGADLPLLLIFAGVIGGLIAFGIVGLFIGPVVLAVAYTLLADWVSESSPSDEQETTQGRGNA